MAEMENEVAALRSKVAYLEEELVGRDNQIARMVRKQDVRDLAEALIQQVESEPEDEPKPKKARKTTAFFVYDREGHKVFFFKDVPCSNDTSEWWEANNIEAVRVVKLFAQAAQLLFHLTLSLFASCVGGYEWGRIDEFIKS